LITSDNPTLIYQHFYKYSLLEDGVFYKYPQMKQQDDMSLKTQYDWPKSKTTRPTLFKITPK